MGWFEDLCRNINNTGAKYLTGNSGSQQNKSSGNYNKGTSSSGAKGENTNPLGNITLNVSSAYGYRPNVGDSDWHNGVDISVPNGTPVYAIRSGTVTTKSGSATAVKGRGLYLAIKNDDATGFAGYLVQHLSKVVVGQGDTVTQGQLIAYTGNSGTGGYHLHFETHKSWPVVWVSDGLGSSTNPMQFTYTNLNGAAIQKAQINADAAESDIDTDGSDSDQTLTYEHIEETEQYFTVYEDDTSRKAVDHYQVSYRKWNGTQAFDITDVFSSVSLKDSTADVCLQLSGTIVANKYDKYLKQINPESGDKISLKNTSTGKVLFTGMVINTSKSGLTGVTSIDALDNGRMLTMNNIITQFQNQPCYDIISTCANKAGIKKISCFPFVSTWTGTYSGQASEMIKTVLDQIAQENGVKYFMRVIGNTVIIKSYGNTVITPYWKAADNIQAAPCLANASEYTCSEDASSIATKIVISDNQNGVNVSVAEAKNDTAIARWGETQQVVSLTGSESVSADDKAIYNLYYGEYSKPTTSYTVSAPGSDAVVAGCLIKMYLDEEPTKFWVTEVEHEYYPTHTMKLTLEKYEEPLDIETLRALYAVTEEGAGEEEEEEEEEEST